MKTLADILEIEGITIRRIPFTETSTFAYREGQKIVEGQEVFFCEKTQRKYVRNTRKLPLGGKWIVRVTSGQGSTVVFDMKRDGIGDSIESAYADFLSK